IGRTLMTQKKYVGIVLAAGQGKRMKSKIQKQFLLINNRPILYYSLRAFQECEDIAEIIVVTGEDSISFCRKEIVEKYGLDKVSHFVAGGRERYDSVYQGLLAAEDADY